MIDDDNNHENPERYPSLEGYIIVGNSNQISGLDDLSHIEPEEDSFIQSIIHFNNEIQKAINENEEDGEDVEFLAKINKPLTLLLNTPIKGFVKFLAKGLIKDFDEIAEHAENIELFKATALPEAAKESDKQAKLKMIKVLRNPLVKPFVVATFRIVIPVVEELLGQIFPRSESKTNPQKLNWFKVYDEALLNWERDILDSEQ